MKKLAAMGVVAVLATGCAKTGRAWLMDNSPYWDMLYEGIKFHIGGIVLGWMVWKWLSGNFRLQGTKTPLLAGLTVFLVLSGIGLYRGYNHIHSPCTFDEVQTRNCPEYKNRSDWFQQQPAQNPY